MAGAPTAKRYAQATFQIAREQGREDGWLEGLELARRALSEPTAAVFLALPRVGLAQKQEAARELLAGQEPLLVNLVQLLIARRSLELLPLLVREYRTLLDISRGRVRAHVTSAVALSDEQQRRLGELLAEMFDDKEVVLDVVQDPEIMGGLIARVGDRVIDGSVRTRLESLKQRLTREAVI